MALIRAEMAIANVVIDLILSAPAEFLRPVSAGRAITAGPLLFQIADSFQPETSPIISGGLGKKYATC
jgi:hypothetical protein